MHYLLFIVAFLWFAFIAPLKVTVAMCLLLVLVTSVIRFTTHAVSGVEPSFGEAAKGIGLSFFFLAIAVFTLLSFSKGTGIIEFTGLAGLAVFASFFAAYVLGFKLSLGVSFDDSAVIAVISTIVSVVLFALTKAML